MATAEIIYQGNLRTEMKHSKSGTIIQTDAPTDNHGKGELFSPTDLAATSLAACMITMMGIAANNHSFVLGKIKAEINKIMAPNPRRIDTIQVKLHFPQQEYSEKQKEILKKVALNCPVAKSLHPDLIQDITFEFEAANPFA